MYLKWTDELLDQELERILVLKETAIVDGRFDDAGDFRNAERYAREEIARRAKDKKLPDYDEWDTKQLKSRLEFVRERRDDLVSRCLFNKAEIYKAKEAAIVAELESREQIHPDEDTDQQEENPGLKIIRDWHKDAERNWQTARNPEREAFFEGQAIAFANAIGTIESNFDPVKEAEETNKSDLYLRPKGLQIVRTTDGLDVTLISANRDTVDEINFGEDDLTEDDASILETSMGVIVLIAQKLNYERAKRTVEGYESGPDA